MISNGKGSRVRKPNGTEIRLKSHPRMSYPQATEKSEQILKSKGGCELPSLNRRWLGNLTFLSYLSEIRVKIVKHVNTNKHGVETHTILSLYSISGLRRDFLRWHLRWVGTREREKKRNDAGTAQCLCNQT